MRIIFIYGINIVNGNHQLFYYIVNISHPLMRIIFIYGINITNWTAYQMFTTRI